MKNLDLIAEELFNKIRGRFPSVTIGDDEGNVTNQPSSARFYDFDFMSEGKSLGKVSITLEDDKIGVMYSNDFVTNEDDTTRDNWYNFLKELRTFAKKRLLQFDTRNITKSNLNRRDYKFLATQRSGEITMESTMYGTSKTSFQNIGDARITIKHSQNINQDMPSDRARHIQKIYVENAEGERFIYPYRHLSGARAMARHVAEGGKPYDDFGQHITGLSEELGKLRKFKTYLGRSSVMAESLAEYVDVVKERMESIKKDLKNLQKESFYGETVANFEKPVFEDVPEDVKENWIEQLTIKQFNEELADVFPYIYKLVSEVTRAKEITPEELLGEAPVDDIEVERPAESYTVQSGDTLYSIAQKFRNANFQGADIEEIVQELMMVNNISKPEELQVGMELEMPYFMGTGPDGATRGLPPGGFQKYESELEDAFEEMMGQFSEEKKKGVDGKACWKGYRYAGRERKPDGTYKDKCVKVEGVDMLDLDTFFEARGDAPSGDRITTDENPLVSSYDDEFKQGKPGLSGHMNLKTYMNIIGISEKYQDMLAKAVLDAGVGEKISVPDEAKADYDAEREEEGLKPRALWIELSQHHEKEKESDNATEGNKFTKALAKARANNDDEMEVDGEKIPVTEFVLSYFDRNTGQFPKGETAVLTMVEKEYGDEYIEPAKKFIEMVNNRVAEVMGYKDADVEESGLQYHIGKKKYGKEGMAKLAQAGREGASEEELGRIKDEYARESEDLRKLAGL